MSKGEDDGLDETLPDAAPVGLDYVGVLRMLGGKLQDLDLFAEQVHSTITGLGTVFAGPATLV